MANDSKIQSDKLLLIFYFALLLSTFKPDRMPSVLHFALLQHFEDKERVSYSKIILLIYIIFDCSVDFTS